MAKIDETQAPMPGISDHINDSKTKGKYVFDFPTQGISFYSLLIEINKTGWMMEGVDSDTIPGTICVKLDKLSREKMAKDLGPLTKKL